MNKLETLIRGYHLISSNKKIKITYQSICSFLNIPKQSTWRLFRSIGIKGRAGYGFKYTLFKTKLESILGLKKYKIAVVGFEEVGHYLLKCDWLLENYEVAALFEPNSEFTGTWNNLVCEDISNLSRIINEKGIDIAVITSSDRIDKISSELRKSNIKGIWNFTPAHIEMPENILVENAFDGIIRLSYRMTEEKEESV